MTTCDLGNGTSTIETYLDPGCTSLLFTTADNPACENILVDGEASSPGGPGSTSADCSNMREWHGGMREGAPFPFVSELSQKVRYQT